MHYIDNFHLVGTGSGTAKYIQLLSDNSIKLGLVNATEELPTSSGYTLPELSDAGTITDGGASEIDNGADCTVNADVNTTEKQWYIEDLTGNINTGVRLHVLTSSGEKWYLRAPLQGGVVDLVCEDYIRSLASVRKHAE